MKVLLPQPIEPEAVTILKEAGCHIVTAADPGVETVLPLLKDAEGIILRTGITMTKELICAAERLMIIARTGAGLDNVDISAATECGVVVTSNIGVNTISVTEHVLAIILGLSKQLFLMDLSVRNDNFKIRYKNLPCDINGKTLGLLGFGRIGSHLGKICHEAFNMPVIAYDPYISEDIKKQFHPKIKFVDMDTLFSQSDILSIHVPLNDQTHHIVGTNQFSMMKSNAIIINTSRGGIIDEDALATALQQEKILGAGLDVFSREPLPKESLLTKLKNVILTPHSAALTEECVIRMATDAARNIVDVFTGKAPKNVANKETLQTGRLKITP